MIKKIFSTLKVTALVTMLAIGVNYVSAWTAPTATPPSANVAAPVNQSPTAGPQTVYNTFTATKLIAPALQINTGFAAGKVLTSDSSGNATWQSTGSSLPTGTAGQTMYSNGTSWLATSTLYVATSTGNVGIGTSAPSQKLHIAGNIRQDFAATSAGTSGMQMVANDGAGNWSEYINSTGSPSPAFITEGAAYRRTTSLYPVASASNNLIYQYANPGSAAAAITWKDYLNLDAVNNKLSILPTNGSVGIGTTDSGSFQGPLVVYDNASLGLSSVMTLLGSTNSLESLNFAKGNTGTDRYTGKIWYNQGTDTMTFNTSATSRVTIDGTGKVGIGTQTPGANLEVAGSALINGMHIGHGTGTIQDPSSTAVGVSALGASNIGSYNTAFGNSVLLMNTSGTYNTANGTFALETNNSGSQNTAMGVLALGSNQSGGNNTAQGFSALWMNTTASDTTAIGTNALAHNRTGSGATAVGSGAMQYSNDTTTAFTSYNTAVGYQALMGSATPSANTGTANTAAGYQALSSNTSGGWNTANGELALNSNTTGNFNTANGERALLYNTTGAQNVALGGDTLLGNTTGNYNTAVGYQTLYANSTGYNNVAIGGGALQSNITGYNNTAIGTLALSSPNPGYNNTAIGYGASVASTTNATAIGYGANATASNMVRIGNSAVTVVQGQVAYSYPSDIRLKENIANYTHGLDLITKLRPVTYSLKADTTHATHQGFIAQEVEAIGVPFYGINKPANKNDFYSLSYSDFVVPLVNSVKELKAENDTLSAKVDKLQADNAALLSRIERIEAKLK